MEHEPRGEGPTISSLLLRHGIAASMTRARQARRAGLGDADSLVLAHLLDAGELTAAELGTRLVLGAAQTGMLVEALVQDGFLARRVTPTEPPEVLLRSTPLARATLSPTVVTVPELPEPLDRVAVARFFDTLVEATEHAASTLARDARRIR